MGPVSENRHCFVDIVHARYLDLLRALQIRNYFHSNSSQMREDEISNFALTLPMTKRRLELSNEIFCLNIMFYDYDYYYY